MAEQPPAPAPLRFERSNDFSPVYANNARFEATVWDLKLIFGEVDLSSGNEVVIQHTAITVPWSLVKLLIFFLQGNLILHEAQNGKVRVPPNQLPAPFPAPTEPLSSNSDEIVNAINLLREQFIQNM